MVDAIRFHCPGVVKSERKRQKVFRNKAGRTIIGSRVDEPDRADFKARLAFYAQQACREPLQGPVALSLHIARPQPESYPKRATKSKPWPWADITKGGGDCDNFAKICQDALNGIAFQDDAQIVDLRVTKGWGQHGVTVEISVVDAPAEEGEAA